jgi:glycosyltransferase involved in cell wall biosynthesis
MGTESMKFANSLVRLLGPGASGLVCSALGRTGLVRQSLKSYYILRTDPVVVYVGNNFSHITEMAALLKGRRVHFIKNFYHSLEGEGRMQALASASSEFRKKFPRHEVHYLASTEREFELMRHAGVGPAHFINKNAFVDEDMFAPVAGIEPDFDAVHNGQLLPYKRHELAAAVERLALIVYRHPSARTDPSHAEYDAKIRQLLLHARWLNDIDSFVAPFEIPRLLAQARSGLCLSAEEGPMAASMEYLMCGLPVVSTRNVGGRDVFFDEHTSITVADDPGSVARGVAELVGRGLSRELVRERVLEKVRVHRERFVELVNGIGASTGNRADFAEEFPRIFSNKLRMSATFPGGFLSHVAKGMPVERCRHVARLQNQ